MIGNAMERAASRGHAGGTGDDAAPPGAGGRPSDFLRLLYPGGVPVGYRVVLWAKRLAAARSFSLSDASQADRHLGSRDLYLHACLCPGEMNGTRLSARDARGLPGVWLDVDVAGGPEAKKKPPAPSRQAALALGKALLPPTAIVDSGYGLHLWWLFEEPWIFGNEFERQQAERISQGWHRRHQRLALRRGFTVDSCFDLARLMRLPRTLNAKDPQYPVPVRLLPYDGPRHSFEAVARLAVPFAPSAVATGEGPVLSSTAPLPIAKFRALLDSNRRFSATWQHERNDLRDRSLSGYDMALVALAARAGWTDDELGALIRAHRRAQGDRSGKGRYREYLARTIRRARERERPANEAAPGHGEPVGRVPRIPANTSPPARPQRAPMPESPHRRIDDRPGG